MTGRICACTGVIGAFLWDLVLEHVCHHYAESSGVARRSLALRPTDVVVDVGGGTGGVSAPLHPDARQVIVVEPSSALVRRGHRRHDGLDFVRAAGQRLPLGDRSVDAILLIEVLHHVPDDGALLAEAARVLRPGGRLLIEEVEFAGLRRLRYWAERVVTDGVWPRTRAGLCDALVTLGFRPQLLEHEGFVILATR